LFNTFIPLVANACGEFFALTFYRVTVIAVTKKRLKYVLDGRFRRYV